VCAIDDGKWMIINRIGGLFVGSFKIWCYIV